MRVLQSKQFTFNSDLLLLLIQILSLFIISDLMFTFKHTTTKSLALS